MREKILEVDNLVVVYDKVFKALDKINLSIYRREILGIVGESGCGKTTLALSLINLLPPSAQIKGKIYFEGKDILSFSFKDLNELRRGKIGFVFQSPQDSFDPVFTIGYQFKEFLGERLKRDEEIKKIIYVSLEKVKIYDKERILKSYPHQLSGGQLQRLAIAFAISLSPSLLVADEPTSNLDVTVESQIVHLFLELRDSLDLTIIFITHNLDLARVLCDRIAVIYQGKLVEVGARERILESPQHPYTKLLVDSFKEFR